MSLSNELISEFVKATKDEDKTTTKESTAYGTAKVDDDGKVWVKLDGSDLYTPIEKTADVVDGERVTVQIKDHTATITGNVTSPAARVATVDELGEQISEFDIILADAVTTDELNAERARIDELVAKDASLEQLIAEKASIGQLEAESARVDELIVKDAEIDELVAKKIDAETASLTFATIVDLDAITAEVHNLDATYATIQSLDVVKADIETLNADKLSAESAEILYANIDFTNIGTAAIENFYSKSGLIENIVVGDGTITGSLVGVTIKGDLIEGNTIVADKLVIRGDDGLYYKLNTDGVTTEAEQTKYNSLNGSVITAKSITATKISVSDLVAFDATIGGFNITDGAIYSGVKESIDNSTSGIFIGSDGQVAFGNSENYLKFYAIYSYYDVIYDESAGTYTRSDIAIDMLVGDLVEGAYTNDGYRVYSVITDDDTVIYFCRVPVDYKLAISADSILFGTDSKYSLDDVKHLTDHVTVGTYDDPETGETLPCVELSEVDSDFKMRLTNKNASFMDGTNDSTTIDSDGIETENLRVKNDIRHYDYVWRRRSNGNLGLMWMEVTE